MVHLLPECSLVASGYLGFELTDHWDGHAYLVRSAGEALLIDTGCGRDSAAIADRIDADLADRADLVGIALTHGHVDHSGGTADLAARFGVPVFASALAADRLARGDEDAVGLTSARASGVYPTDQVLRAVPGIHPAVEIAVGDLTVRAHSTPGHSADHVVYTVQLPTGLAMFTGDLIFSRGRTAVLDTHDTDRRLYEESIRQMNELRPDHLFPGHGSVVLSRAGEHLQNAVDAYDIGSAPAGLVA